MSLDGSNLRSGVFFFSSKSPVFRPEKERLIAGYDDNKFESFYFFSRSSLVPSFTPLSGLVIQPFLFSLAEKNDMDTFN